MSNEFETTAEVGMGATVLRYPGTTAGTIIKVTKNQIHVQEDTTTRNDGVGSYSYTTNPDGRVWIFRKTKRGYQCEGKGLVIGTRNPHGAFYLS